MFKATCIKSNHISLRGFILPHPSLSTLPSQLQNFRQKGYNTCYFMFETIVGDLQELINPHLAILDSNTFK